MSDSISLGNSPNASELSLNTIESLLREADNIQNLRDWVTPTSFESKRSQLEVIADATVDHGGRGQKAWGGESKDSEGEDEGVNIGTDVI